MYSLIYFDTEDSISPPEAGSDDIVLWIAQVLDRHGMKGSFHIIGDKARSLAKRERTDIIDALQQHDVSSHYNHGSVHPNTTELVAKADWDDGVRIALEQEKQGFTDIERIFGRCSGLTRHGGSYAPQTVCATGMCDKVFYGIPFHPPSHRAFWFAGTLCFSIVGLVVGEADGVGAGYFEHLYHDDAKFEAHLEAFGPALAATMKQWSFTSLFGCHPHRLNTTEFSCWNYYRGQNRTPPLPPPQRDAAEKKTIRRNFERLVAYLAKVEGLKILGLGDLASVFGETPKVITREHLRGYAQRVCDSDDVPLDDVFSPAELLVGLAESVIDGALPDTVSVAKVIGPSGVERGALHGRVTDVAREVIDHVRETGRLPSHDPAGALEVLAKTFVALDRGQPVDDVTDVERAPYPRAADDWREQVESMKGWSVFGPEMDFGQIVELTCLQGWSVKPARCSEQ